MKRLFLAAATAAVLLLPACVQQQMQQIAYNSKVVVLDIGHYYEPTRGGQGARTPDARYGVIEETDFWYRYAGEVKKTVEAAGYTCRICNRGDVPTNRKLAAAAEKAGVHHVKSPEPTAIYRSTHHPKRVAVGMLSTNYALDQQPGAVVFLHHNSNSEKWRVYNKGAFYCNKVGVRLAQTMAQVMNRDIIDTPDGGMPNHGVPCGVVLRDNGRLGGGDWLNACNESYVPAVITEVAFLSNPEHAKYLSKHQNAVKFAQAIGRGIVEFLNQR
ncbi:MAG: N-acetylmuramoyl-L-alanine amidase [Akkermansia sp.]|nr:N-acetylmuramoyl-L-alanine amidase [Akkermansia sp.]